MRYQIFSDRDLLPPLPKDPQLPREITDIEMEPFIHVGGKEKFIMSSIGCNELHMMTDHQSAKFQLLTSLERDGVFNRLQESIICDYVRNDSGTETLTNMTGSVP
jgi:hypothetical protein